MVPAPAPRSPARCPCCGLRASLAASEEGVLCGVECAPCGGSCMGLLQREPVQAAPPLARRPVEDFNWVMRN